MEDAKMLSKTHFLFFTLLFTSLHCVISNRHYKFVVKEAIYTRLCETKKILTVNGKFPGPTIHVLRGHKVIVDIYNRGNENITIHWHGVHQPKNPWSDGPAYITQCPIQPGNKFRNKVIFSEEEGTLWWHAHSNWSRATVHGAIIIHPPHGSTYPFPRPHAEVPIILGEWWKEDVKEVLEEFVASGGQPNTSDAYTINGQPGDLYPCSKRGTFKLKVKKDKTYLLRVINADMNEILLMGVAQHNLTVVGIDASYTKPFTTTFISIPPGQTIDCLLHAGQSAGRYYIAARSYTTSSTITFNNSTTTAILDYIGNKKHNTSSSSSSPPLFPRLPNFNDTNAVVSFTTSLRGMAKKEYLFDVPLNATVNMLSTISINNFLCDSNKTCAGPNGTRLAASMNNISFVSPSIDVLEAYYYHLRGVFKTKFPDFPPYLFNFTADEQPLYLEVAERGTRVKVLKYNAVVEIVLQGTSLNSGIDHPMHLHGYTFYVVGWGFGNFDKEKDPQNYNLVDPPRQNTVLVPRNGWAAIRFRANNPGVWFMHCHFERHVTWGMETVFIVKNGKRPEERILPRPHDMPPC